MTAPPKTKTIDLKALPARTEGRVVTDEMRTQAEGYRVRLLTILVTRHHYIDWESVEAESRLALHVAEKLWVSPSFTFRGSWGNHVYMVVRRHIIDEQRRQGGKRGSAKHLGLYLQCPLGVSPTFFTARLDEEEDGQERQKTFEYAADAQLFERLDTNLILWDAVNRLPTHQREMLYHFLDGIPIKEVAVLHNRSPRWAADETNKALRALRALIEEEMPELLLP